MAKRAVDLFTREPGHPEVEHDRVRDRGLREPQALDAVGRDHAVVAGVLQRGAHDGAHVPLVVDDQDASSHEGRE